MFKCSSHQALRLLIQREKGSVLIVSIILMVVAGVSALSWIGYINSSQRAAIRDRDRVEAFYAAESGVEQIVDFFNNPSHFGTLGLSEPSEYTSDIAAQPNNYSFRIPGDFDTTQVTDLPWPYGMFEPYVSSIKYHINGDPIVISGSYVPDNETYFSNTGATNDEGEIDERAVSRTSKIPTCEIDVSGLSHFSFKGIKGEETARITEIRLVHPDDLSDAELPEDERTITKVFSTAVTPSGVEVTVESLITESTILSISSAAAIITRQTGTWNGQFNVFWGEVWAGTDVELSNVELNKMPRYDESVDFEEGNGSGGTKDKWFRLRTEGVVKDDGGGYADIREDDGFADAPIDEADGDIYYTPFDPGFATNGARSVKSNDGGFQTNAKPDKPANPGGGGGGSSDFEGLENIKQNQELNWPDYDYDELKEYVQSNEFGYFFTDENGNIYGIDTDPNSITYGQYVQKSYHDWFNTSESDSTYNDIDELLVFIDSYPMDDNGDPGPVDANGVPIINETYYPRNPRELPSGATLPTISISGNGTHSHGAFFIAANVTKTGAGNPPSMDSINAANPGTIVMPNDNNPPNGDKKKVFHNGLFWSWGTVNMGGNPIVYGSIYAEDGYAAGGTPDVYYNYRMADGSWLSLNSSRVKRTLWDITTEYIDASEPENES